jgi:O-antigen/teichoic acid export membrane protein
LSLHELLRFGGVMQLATMVPPISEYTLRLMVGAKFGVEYAGIYDLAARGAVALRSLAGALFSAMVPFGVQTLASEGTDGVSRLNRLAVKYTALFIFPLSALLILYAEPLVRIWLGEGPVVDAVRACFVILLVAHAVGSLPVPTAMLGRASGRPVPEALVTLTSFSVAISLASIAPSVPVAAGIFWGVPALGGGVLSAWIARRLSLRFDGWRDLALVMAVAIIGYGTAAAASAALGGWHTNTGALATLAGAVIALVAMAVSAVAMRLVSGRERTAFMTYLGLR